MKPLFVTGNAHKAEHFKQLLGVNFDYQKLDVDEIQARDPADIVERKARQAYELVRRPVFVDDFSFWFDDLDGMPGPFIKFFIGDTDKLEKLCRLADGLPSRRVTARAYFGYFDGTDVTTLYGELKGEITDHPRGDADYAIATDFVFAVDGYGGRTRGELTRDEYVALYQKVRASQEVTAFLRSRV